MNYRVKLRSLIFTAADLQAWADKFWVMIA
jgi:hypothetical protein